MTSMLEQVERRCVLLSLDPLVTMPPEVLRSFTQDLGLPATAAPSAVVSGLVEVVMQAPRADRDKIVATILSSASSASASAREHRAPTASFAGAPSSASSSSSPPYALSSSSAAAAAAGMTKASATTTTTITTTTITTPSGPPPSYSASVIEPSVVETSLDGRNNNNCYNNNNNNNCYNNNNNNNNNSSMRIPNNTTTTNTAAAASAPKQQQQQKRCLPRSTCNLVSWLLATLGATLLYYGLVVVMALDHTRYHVQVFAGVTGGLFFWPLTVVFVVGLAKGFCSPVHPRKWGCRVGLSIACIIVCSFALYLPIGIIFGSGIQGTLYYEFMQKEYNVSLGSIPYTSDTLAYNTRDGYFDKSTFHVYSVFSYDSDTGEPANFKNAYSVQILGNLTQPAFGIFAASDDSSNVPSTYFDVFDTYENWLIRLDCARDDDCSLINAGISQTYHDKFLPFRNKNPFDRLRYYKGIMYNTVIAAAVFYAIQVAAVLVLAVGRWRDLTAAAASSSLSATNDYL